MIYTIKNDQISASIDSLGAQVRSLKTSAREYIWQGDPEFWTGQAPLLFPIIGSIKDKTVTIGGKECHLSNHGFLRELEFDVVTQTEDTITFSASFSDETLACYPFKFQFIASYTVKDTACEMTYEVKNIDDKTMPFFFGLHPALNCNVTDEEKFEDYYLKFDVPITITRPYYPEVAGDYPDLDNMEVLSKDSDIFPLSHEKFLLYSLVQDKINFSKSDLYHKEQGKIVDFDFEGFDTYTLWQPHYAPFICLEPWTGLSGIAPYSPNLEDNRLCKFVDKNDSKLYKLTITTHI